MTCISNQKQTQSFRLKKKKGYIMNVSQPFHDAYHSFCEPEEADHKRLNGYFKNQQKEYKGAGVQ